MKAFCCLILALFLVGFWAAGAFGLTLNTKQVKALAATINQLEAERDEAKALAAEWRKKAQEHGCT